jgi:hypothetical protein
VLEVQHKVPVEPMQVVVKLLPLQEVELQLVMQLEVEEVPTETQQVLLVDQEVEEVLQVQVEQEH